MDLVATLSSQGKLDWGTQVRSSGTFLSNWGRIPCFVLARPISLKTELEGVWPWCHRHGVLRNLGSLATGQQGPLWSHLNF